MTLIKVTDRLPEKGQQVTHWVELREEPRG